ncbi:MAG: flavin reductase family protein [Acidimicrobiia bacterium]
MVDTRELRNTLGRFATGVTVVTCQTPDGAHGMTVNAFSAVSLEPPLVLVSIDRRARACSFLDKANFVVNVLSCHDADVGLHFAGRPKEGISVEWVEGPVAPRLAGTVAYFACKPWANYDGGDHILFVGHVEEFGVESGEPLLFYSGRFRQLGDPMMGSPWLSSVDNPAGSGWVGDPFKY